MRAVCLASPFVIEYFLFYRIVSLLYIPLLHGISLSSMGTMRVVLHSALIWILCLSLRILHTFGSLPLLNVVHFHRNNVI